MEPAVLTMLVGVLSRLIIVGRPRRHAFFVALRRAGSPTLRLEAFPMAGVIPGSRSAVKFSTTKKGQAVLR